MHNQQSNMISAGQLVVNTLETLAVTRLFSVPGESYLEVLDALHDSSINNTICRQEGGAAMAAEAWGKATGTPGICFVTRGPGATNASSGLHVAQQDSTPMILFIGQINSKVRHREGFQELNYISVFHSMAKWVAEIESPERIEEMISRAWSVAMSGRPGPVVLVLPEDTLGQAIPAPTRPLQPRTPALAYPCTQQINAFVERINTAKNPVMVVGGSGWNQTAVSQLADFASRFNLPVACSFRRQMLFNHQHSHYAGDLGLGSNPKLLDAVREADLVVLFNCRFSEVPSQNFTLLDIPQPKQTLVHIHTCSEELGKLYHADLAILGGPITTMTMLDNAQATNSQSRQQHVANLHSNYLDWSSLPQRNYPGSVQMPDIITQMQQILPEDTLISNGAGNYASWIHRFWRFQSYGSQLAPTSGSMGYGLPAAIAGKLAAPEKTVICMAGDGCFQMTQQELATAVQANASIIVIIIDNGIYGTIRMHQEQRFPGRESGTRMVNPDFAQMASAYGIETYSVKATHEFAPALKQALQAKGPTVIHVHLHEQVITPTSTLDEIRQQALEIAIAN